jgi:hypothetical protein
LPAATIKEKMPHWPPTTTLVHLDDPHTYYDQRTGAPVTTKYLAVTCRNPEVHTPGEEATHIYPCTEAGDFVQRYMSPIADLPAGTVQDALTELGYTVKKGR